MKNQDRLNKWPDFRFNLEEMAGAVGDYGTLIPIVLGVAIVSNVNLGYMLLFFSFWYIITGIYYKMPVPVEPMKVIGAMVIAEGLNREEIVASGIILGVLFLVLGFGKGMKFIQEKVPQSVIRGIQLGLALLLIKTSFDFPSPKLTRALEPRKIPLFGTTKTAVNPKLLYLFKSFSSGL